MGAALPALLSLQTTASIAQGDAIPPPRLPAIAASSAILVDADTGQVLFSKNADVRRPPASTTKIMTAILLLEKTNPSDVLTASKHAAETGGSSLNLKPGEKITARDMLYALMLRSANDGCVVVAEQIAGSEKKFAEMMTARAKEIGATNTRFCNCNGLNENPNLTTARDLSIMARYAFRFPDFNAVTKSKYYNISRDKSNKDTVLKNHAKFLWHFPGADGVKTGYTNPAGHCFVGAATVNGWRLVSVVLNSPDIVGESSALMKFGFQYFDQRSIAERGSGFGTARVDGGSQATVGVALRDPIRCVVLRGAMPAVEFRPHPRVVRAPAPAGASAGYVEALADGAVVATAPLVTTAGVDRVPAVTLAASGGGGRWLIFAAAAGTVLFGYGTTIAKTARIRRYRLKALLRDANNGGPGLG